jgi:hypothetical protein
MTQAQKTIGQHLQNWLIRNDIAITDPLFVPAADLAIRNAVRDHKKRRATRSEHAATISGDEPVNVCEAI